MDYYNSDFDQDRSGEYFRTSSSPYYPTCNYDVVPFEDDSVSDSTYEFSQDLHFPGYDYDPFSTPPQVNYYDPTPYHDSSLFPSHVNHSNFRGTEPKLTEYITIPNSCDSSYDYPSDVITEPKLLQYDPIPYSTGYFSPDTRFLISYSTSSAAPPVVDYDDGDDIEFTEYDPTPYGGGYDPNLTYGKSLPPSEEICHPRSLPASNGLPLGNFSFGSIPSPYGKDDIVPSLEKAPNKTKKQRAEPIKATDEERKKPSGGKGDGDDEKEPEKPVESSRGEEREGWYSCDDGNYHPRPGYENGDYGCRSYYADYGRPVGQIPYGYGLEGMELCESLFVYWPCLSRQYRRSDWGLPEGSAAAAACEEENRWRSAADYIFGAPYTDGGGGVGGNNSLLTYNNCERHYQEDQLCAQVEGENSWLSNVKTF